MTKLFKNFIEPGVIILIFAVGAIVNRRSSKGQPSSRCAMERSGGALSEDMARSHSWRSLNFAARILAQLLARFPFLREVWYWGLTYWVYQLARAYSAYMIRGDRVVFERAQQHALSILSVEHKLGVDVEQPLQQYVLAHHHIIMGVLPYIYHSHIILGVCFVTYCYTYLPRPLFERIRRTIALDNVIAFVVLTSWRCMPPRLLPQMYGFVDTLHRHRSESVWTNNRFQLTIAAVPSLHFGTALLVGVCLWHFAPHKILRLFAPLWPAAMLLTITATANHFLADAAIGALIPAVSWKFNALLLRLKPLEEWAIRVCGFEQTVGFGNETPMEPSHV